MHSCSWYALRILRSHGLLGDRLVLSSSSTTVCKDTLFLTCVVGLHLWSGLRSEGLLKESSESWYACAIYLPSHLSFFATQLTPTSLPLFWTILVMYCISFCHWLGSLSIPCSPDLITESALVYARLGYLSKKCFLTIRGVHPPLRQCCISPYFRTFFRLRRRFSQFNLFPTKFSIFIH